MANLKIGYFVIGNRMAGAARFELEVTDLGGGELHGAGKLTQAVSPPLEMKTLLTGSMAQTVMGPDVRTIITLIGIPPIDGMPQPDNVRCTIVLDHDKTDNAVAELRYRESGGSEWVVLPNLPVSGGWLNID